MEESIYGYFKNKTKMGSENKYFNHPKVTLYSISPVLPCLILQSYIPLGKSELRWFNQVYLFVRYRSSNQKTDTRLWAVPETNSKSLILHVFSGLQASKKLFAHSDKANCSSQWFKCIHKISDLLRIIHKKKEEAVFPG